MPSPGAAETPRPTIAARFGSGSLMRKSIASVFFSFGAMREGDELVLRPERAELALRRRRRRQLLEEARELELREEAPELGLVPPAIKEVRRVPRDVGVELERDELLREVRVVLRVGEVLAQLLAFDLVEVLVDAVERAVLGQEIGRGLRADARHAP